MRVKSFFFRMGRLRKVVQKLRMWQLPQQQGQKVPTSRGVYWPHGPMDEHVQQSLNLVASRLIWKANMRIFSILKNCAFASHRQSLDHTHTHTQVVNFLITHGGK